MIISFKINYDILRHFCTHTPGHVQKWLHRKRHLKNSNNEGHIRQSQDLDVFPNLPTFWSNVHCKASYNTFNIHYLLFPSIANSPYKIPQGNFNSKITTKAFQMFNATTYCVSLILDFTFLALLSPKNTLNYPKLQKKKKNAIHKKKPICPNNFQFFLGTQEF